MATGTIRATLVLPAELLEANDRTVCEGKARSRSEFVTAALRRDLAARRAAELDASFADMAYDAEYRKEALLYEQELAHASWEAFQVGEAEYHGAEYRGPKGIEAEYVETDA